MKRCFGIAVSLSLAAPASSLAADLTPRDIVTPEMLGAQIPYIESKIGPAYKVEGKNRIYKVGNCEIGVTTGDDNAVAALRVDATDACAFDLKAFLPNDAVPAVPGMTFGAFEASTAEMTYQADCLTMCGNAADPVVYATYEGGHVNNYLTVMLETMLVADDSLDASTKWEAAMKAKEGEDYVIDAKFNCDRKYNAQAQDAFKGVKITAISVGQVKAPVSCDGTR